MLPGLSRLALSCALVALLVAPLAQAQAPPTGGVRTQTLDLVPGPNLVSLNVVPGATDLPTLLGPVLSHLLVVQDAEGRFFAPTFGSTTLSDWAWHQAYLVHVRDSASVTVSGPALSPEARIPLRAGWNWVPYLLGEAQPVEAALSSVSAHLSRVEDEAGRTFPAAAGTPTLDALVPGRGYRLHLTAPDTLVYATLSSPDRTVGTLAEALALSDLVPGQAVEVLGYHTPGDGGGGLFAVTVGNERPDGGVVFVPESALSEPLTYTTPAPRAPNYTFGPVLPNSVYVPHRDWTAVYTPSSGAGPFTINGWQHLTGHRYASRFHLSPDHDGRGIVSIPPGIVLRYGAGTWVLTYRQTTSPLRLVRQGVGSELNVRWFGARAESEAASPADVAIGSDFDVELAIAWAVNFAQRSNEPAFGGTPGTITTVRVPAGTWRFAGPVELTDGLTLAGDGGTEVVDAVTTVQGAPGAPEADVSAQLAAAGYAPATEHPWAGYRTATSGEPVAEVPGSISRWSHQNGVLTLHYRPVRIRQAGPVTRLRMFDGVVARGVRMSANPDDPDALPGDVNYYVGKYQTSVTASSNKPNRADVMQIGVRDLVLDGNHEGNRELWDDGRFGYNGNNAPLEFENWMRNTPSWGGICVSDHNGKVIPVGQTITLRRVAVIGFGSNGLLGDANNRWDAEAVLIGNSLWNHTLYGANGRYRDLTVTGFAWTHLTPTAVDVENLVFENGAPAPYRSGGLLGHRGFDVFSNDDGPAGEGGGVLPTGLRSGFRANGYFLDGRSSGSPGSLGGGAGPETRFEGAVLLRSGWNGGVYSESHNGYMKGLWSGNRFDRVLSTRAFGDGNTRFVAHGPFQGLTSTEHVELQLEPDRAGLSGFYRYPVSLTTGWSNIRRGDGAGPAANTRPWDDKVVQIVDGLYAGAQTESALAYNNDAMRGAATTYNADPAAPSFDIRSGGSRLFLLHARFRNRTNKIVFNSATTGAERYVEFFVRDSEFLLYNQHMNLLANTLRLSYFDRVTFRSQPDRVYRSEDVQTRTAAGGETTLDVATGLFTTPVAPWTAGDQAFTGGTLLFSGSAAAKVSNTQWVQNPASTEPSDWRAPVLRVTFAQPLAAGETLTATMAVRPWPAVSPDGTPVVVPQ